MKNKIKEIIDVIDKKEIPESSLTDALDLCLNIYFLSFTEPDTKKLIRDEILLLIEDTNYDLSPKKYLIYFYFLKYTSDDGNWSLNDVVLYNFFKNLRFIKSEIILNQIYGVIITILLPNPDKINILFNIWESIFLSESDNFLELKSLTKMIHFICSKLFCETNVHPYLKNINNNIINIFYKSYKKRSNFCSDTKFLAKIEYSQNLLFPLLIKHFDFIERASKSEFIDTITKLFEDKAYFRFSVFTLRIPNLIELIIDSGYTFDRNEIKEMLYKGITNQEQEVRRSTKFILEKIENKIGKLYNTSTKKECYSNNLNSFLCILDCYENFSIHLLKANWEKFKSLMSNIQDINREWWVKTLIKIGLNHQNLNVQRFIAFNTINFCIERSNFLPIWMTKELFFEIYLKYILSSLNNRISLQVEELFVKFVYIILKKNKEWISEYLIFISKTVLSFTPFRIMIYPLTIGALHEYDFNCNNNSHPKNEDNLAKFLEVDYNLLSETNLELTKRYGFEFNIEFKDSIKIQKECFIELLDISIVIIKYIPIIMRQEMYFLWIKIILNYLNYHEFFKKDLITKLIQLLGIIPEYLYHGKINHIVEYFVKNKNIYIDTSVSPKKLFEKSNKWYLILQYGIGFGRLKKILCIKSGSTSILENDIIFISSYYNNEEVDKIDINIEKKIEYIYSNIKLLLEDSQECKNIDIDLLWFYTHSFSLISERDKDNLLLNKLFDWCIENIIQIDTLLEKMKRSVYCLISVIFIIKCMIHLQKYMNFASDETCVQVINNLMVITSSLTSKLTMNNKMIKSWDSYRRNCCQYDIVDVNSVNNDKYCIIYSSKLIIGNPDKYLPEMNKGHINRLIQLFPNNLREFISTFSKLKFMFIDICVLKNIRTLSNSILKQNIIYWKLLSDNNSREIFSQVSGSIWNWHEHFFALILYELNNFGTEDFYLWRLVEYSFIQISKNYLMFQKTIVSEYLNKIFELIKKHCVELIDKSIYNDLLITKLNSILTNSDFISLFKETNIFEDVINFYYNKILFNNNETRFFIFPLLNFVYLFIKGCNENIISSLFQNIVSNKECSLSNEERRIIKVSNVILELLIFEEKGLIDGYNLRFQKVGSNDKLELNKIFELYKKCKIFEDYNSFMRHSTIIYLYNSIQISSENYNKNHLFFVQLVIFLLTLKLDHSIPISVEEGLVLNGTNFYKKNFNNLDIFVENKYSTNKNSNKFPPLPNSVQHKLLINIWQSLCCFIDALKSDKTEFNLYILEFYFRHLCYLYNPDIRQYMDLFGCNVVILFPSFCIKYLAQGLSNNGNNHTQVIYSLLIVSSYLIYYLRKKTPFVYNENILKDTNFKDEFFVHKGINWIKFEKRVLENYIMFFNIFLSYYTSNSSLLRNIVLLTLYLLYKDDSVSLLVNDSNEASLFSNEPQRYSISNIIDQALSTNNFESIIELFENSGHPIRNEMPTNKSFLVNSMIIEESIGLREVIKNIVRSKDTKKMLTNLDKIWRLWKPKRYCSLENIIPNDNIIEFTNQKVSQSFFNTCQAFDPILSALEESNQEGDDEFQELIAFQDRNDEFLLNSHLIFGDLRPSWSLYYLLKKVICNEMSKNYHESPKLQEVRTERTLTPRNDYQLKFEPETAPQLLSEESRPKRLDLFGENRTELIVIASLLDKIPNIAGLTRTCEIFRVKELLINTKKTLSDPMFKQISVTAEKWLPINELSPERISEYINIKRLEGYGVYGLEQTSSSIPLKDFEFPKKSILILGRENEGIPSDIVSVVDHCIEIPQFGMIRSLNVHVSASIVIHEYTTQVLNLT